MVRQNTVLGTLVSSRSCSFDGCTSQAPHIVMGSTDGTVCVLHAKKGKIISNFHHGKAVKAAMKKKDDDEASAEEEDDFVAG